jgi:hypothetical protein
MSKIEDKKRSPSIPLKKGEEENSIQLILFSPLYKGGWGGSTPSNADKRTF